MISPLYNSTTQKLHSVAPHFIVPAMDEASNPQQNGGFPSLSAAIKCCVLKAAIKGAEKLMLDGRKRKNPSVFAATPLGNRASSPVSNLQSSAAQMLMLMKKKQNQWISPNYNGLVLTFNLLKLPQIVLMKLIAFQFHLLTSFLTFPIRVSTNTLRRVALGRLANKNPVLTLCGSVANRAIADAKKKTRDVGVKLGRAVLCFCFVGLVLLGMLASGFLVGSLLVGWVVEPPFQGKVALNFDYTKASPMAFIPLAPSSSGSGTLLGRAVIPRNRKMEVTVSLVMPESDYNRNLGMFQVKVELVSASGKVTTSTSRPCMLPFKSHPVRLAETIIKTLPLLAGLASESQLVDLRMDDQLIPPPQTGRPDPDPTAAASLTVALEQRAEFINSPGAGIPQVYGAWLKLHYELPRMKMLLWQWRRLVHVLVGIALFFTQLAAVLGLVLCRQLIVAPAGRKAKDAPMVKVFGAKKKMMKYLQ